jgi:DNA repair protein RadC
MAAAIVDITKPLGIATQDHIIVGNDGRANLQGLRLI